MALLSLTQTEALALAEEMAHGADSVSRDILGVAITAAGGRDDVRVNAGRFATTIQFFAVTRPELVTLANRLGGPL